MRPRHGNELPRSIEPDGFVPQGSKVTEIAAGSAPEIKDRIRRVAVYRIEECRVILADIVVPRTVPERPCESVVKRDCRFAEAADSFWLVHLRVGFISHRFPHLCQFPASLCRMPVESLILPASQIYGRTGH